MTTAVHFKTIHPSSVSASTDQARINAEYTLVAEEEAHPRIQQLFHEKLQVGKSYLQAQSPGHPLSFHDFMRSRDLHPSASGGR